MDYSDLTVLWHFQKEYAPILFYDTLNTLNGFFTKDFTPQDMHNLQVKNLEEYYGKVDNGYTILNNFLRDIAKSFDISDNLFTHLIEGMNEGIHQFTSDKKSPEYIQWHQLNNRNNKAEKYEKNLIDITKKIENIVRNLNPNNPLPAPSIQPVIDAVKRGLSGRSVSKFRQDFIAAKGEYLEQLGIWIANMAGLTGMVTGNWYVIDESLKESQPLQLIMDGMIIDEVNKQKSVTSVQPGEGLFKLKLTNYNKMNSKKKKSKSKTMEKWLNSIAELNGVSVSNGEVTINTAIGNFGDFFDLINIIDSSKPANLSVSVHLNEKFFKELQERVLGLQAKSNQERHLVNDSNRKVYHMSAYDKYLGQLKKFSQMKPVTEKTAVSQEEYDNDTEENTFHRYVNYTLSRNIAKTVYNKNQFYLYKGGFLSLPDLMRKEDLYVTTVDASISYAQFLDGKFNIVDRKI